MKTTTGLISFFVFSLFFLSNCFSISQITRYYPKKLVIYPLARYAEFYYFVNITYNGIPKQYCNNTSAFKNYIPYIFGEVSTIYPPSKIPKVSIKHIGLKYFKENKTCVVSIEYKYQPKINKSKNTVYIEPLILNPYPDVFDPNIVNISNFVYKINGFMLCLPKIYEIRSVIFAKYKIFFAFNMSNFPVSMIVLNISKPHNGFNYSEFKEKSIDKVLRCYYIKIPYLGSGFKKIKPIKIQNLSYDLYYYDCYGIYGFVFARAKTKINKKQTNTNKNHKKSFKKIYILILIILVIVILGLLYYYIRKERGEW